MVQVWDRKLVVGTRRIPRFASRWSMVLVDSVRVQLLAQSWTLKDLVDELVRRCCMMTGDMRTAVWSGRKADLFFQKDLAVPHRMNSGTLMGAEVMVS